MHLNPESIYRNYKNKALDKRSASNLLITIIENSSDELLRIKCLKLLQGIRDTDPKVFKLLESLLISDLNKSIRIAAFEALQIFSLKAINPIKYAIKREKDQFLINLIEFLAKIDPFICKQIIIKKIKKLGINCFENSLDEVKIETLSLKSLKNSFFNHIFFTSLENLYFHRRKIPFAVDLFYLD
ncbi:MAG: HEAT repeat domain-containing protein [Promethearchaeota archaeon]